MVLNDPPAASQPLGNEFRFSLESRDVRVRDSVLVRRGYHMAAAEQAPVLAERKMGVERERIVDSLRGNSETIPVLGTAESVVELDGRGIRRVSRTGPVIASQQFRTDNGDMVCHHVGNLVRLKLDSLNAIVKISS
jgi:hypothetical protein